MPGKALLLGHNAFLDYALGSQGIMPRQYGLTLHIMTFLNFSCGKFDTPPKTKRFELHASNFRKHKN
jgi:hypothetical protein